MPRVSVTSVRLELTSRLIAGSEDAPARGGRGVPRVSVNRQNDNRALTQSGTSPGYARASTANLENVSTFASPLINIGLLVESVTHFMDLRTFRNIPPRNDVKDLSW